MRFLDVYIVALPEKTRALYDALSNTLWDPARIRFHQRKPRVWNAAEEPPAVADLGGVSEVTLTITSWSGWETGPAHPNAEASPCWDFLFKKKKPLGHDSSIALSMTACCSASLTLMTCRPRG